MDRLQESRPLFKKPTKRTTLNKHVTEILEIYSRITLMSHNFPLSKGVKRSPLLKIIVYQPQGPNFFDPGHFFWTANTNREMKPVMHGFVFFGVKFIDV